MSDHEVSDQEALSAMHDWNARIIEEFRAHEGNVGGNFEGAPVLLLHTTGAKSGVQRVNPMMYLNENGRIYVFASKAGADSHPDWFYNLLATPQVAVELGSETFDAMAVNITGDERTRIYAQQVIRFPGFGEYQEKTARVIPVVELVRN